MDHLPPLPWSFEENRPASRAPWSGFVYIVDARGNRIGVIYGRPQAKEAVTDFIVRASRGNLAHA